MGVDNGNGTYSTIDPSTEGIVHVRNEDPEDKLFVNWAKKLHEAEKERGREEEKEYR